jgi:hypothetical protein
VIIFQNTLFLLVDLRIKQAYTYACNDTSANREADMATEKQMKSRQIKLKQQASELLGDFLIGSLSTKGPKRPGFNLTCKVDQITRSRHVRKEHEKRVARMIRKHKRLKALIQQLAAVNWELLKIEE